jgi:hypothetical protein
VDAYSKLHQRLQVLQNTTWRPFWSWALIHQPFCSALVEDCNNDVFTDLKHTFTNHNQYHQHYFFTMNEIPQPAYKHLNVHEINDN